MTGKQTEPSRQEVNKKKKKKKERHVTLEGKNGQAKAGH